MASISEQGRSFAPGTTNLGASDTVASQSAGAIPPFGTGFALPPAPGVPAQVGFQPPQGQAFGTSTAATAPTGPTVNATESAYTDLGGLLVAGLLGNVIGSYNHYWAATSNTVELQKMWQEKFGRSIDKTNFDELAIDAAGFEMLVFHSAAKQYLDVSRKSGTGDSEALSGSSLVAVTIARQALLSIYPIIQELEGVDPQTLAFMQRYHNKPDTPITLASTLHARRVGYYHPTESSSVLARLMGIWSIHRMTRDIKLRSLLAQFALVSTLLTHPSESAIIVACHLFQEGIPLLIPILNVLGIQPTARVSVQARLTSILNSLGATGNALVLTSPDFDKSMLSQLQKDYGLSSSDALFVPIGQAYYFINWITDALNFQQLVSLGPFAGASSVVLLSALMMSGPVDLEALKTLAHLPAIAGKHGDGSDGLSHYQVAIYLGKRTTIETKAQMAYRHAEYMLYMLENHDPFTGESQLYQVFARTPTEAINFFQTYYVHQGILQAYDTVWAMQNEAFLTQYTLYVNPAKLSGTANHQIVLPVVTWQVTHHLDIPFFEMDDHRHIAKSLVYRPGTVVLSTDYKVKSAEFLPTDRPSHQMCWIAQYGAYASVSCINAGYRSPYILDKMGNAIRNSASIESALEGGMNEVRRPLVVWPSNRPVVGLVPVNVVKLLEQLWSTGKAVMTPTDIERELKFHEKKNTKAGLKFVRDEWKSDLKNDNLGAVGVLNYVAEALTTIKPVVVKDENGVEIKPVSPFVNIPDFTQSLYPRQRIVWKAILFAFDHYYSEKKNPLRKLVNNQIVVSRAQRRLETSYRKQLGDIETTDKKAKIWHVQVETPAVAILAVTPTLYAKK